MEAKRQVCEVGTFHAKLRIHLLQKAFELRALEPSRSVNYYIVKLELSLNSNKGSELV